MAVKAPFRFARINRWIHEPAWGPLVSHDVPFVDGLSGSATVRITAKTPILVGGRRRPASETRAGAVWPFRLPDGGWAIPPATLQGMCRSILEVAAFGRLGPWIEDRRFGIRDLTDTATARHHYRDFLRHTQAGWLVERDGKRWIVGCEMARLGHRELNANTGLDFGNERVPLKERYEAVGRWQSAAGGRLYFRLTRGKVHTLAEPARNGTAGTVVITGYVAKKKKEFVFHGPDRQGLDTAVAPRFEVSDTVWETFLYLHCDSKQKPTHPAWDFWETDYKNGEPVPVFWWPDPEDRQKVATFGTAFAFKAGFPLSTHNLLDHSHTGHTKESAEAALDLPHLIFGAVAESDKGLGLKRRAWFGLARTVGGQQGSLHRFAKPGILSNPKPGYLGLYVRQRPSADNTILQGRGNREPMAAYKSVHASGSDVGARDTAEAVDNLRRPELAGVKLWPSSRDRDRGIQIPDPPKVEGAQPPGPLVQTELSAVPAGTVFETTLMFHNLRRVELGAVLWALSFGDPGAFRGDRPRLRHRLGMGKPFGLGEVEIDIPSLALDDGAALGPEELLSAFTAHMEAVYPRSNAWARSPQVLALRKAADPDANRAADLRYMDVTGPASYVENRKRGAFLGPYVDETDEIDRPPAPRRAEPPASAKAARPSGARAGGPSQQTVAPRGGAVLGQQIRYRAGQRVQIDGEVAALCEDVSHAARPEDEVLAEFGDGPEPVKVGAIERPA